MSKRRKQLHRKPRNRHGAVRHVDYACRYACTLDAHPESIEEAKRASHDALIDQLGARRRGGVRWWVVPPPQIAAFLDDVESLPTDPTDGQVETADDMRAWFTAHPAGVLVVALAPAIPS